jgi:hypothetical protein
MTSLGVKLRSAIVDDKEFLFDLARTVYKKLVIDQFGNWDEKLQRNYFEKKWKMIFKIESEFWSYCQ